MSTRDDRPAAARDVPVLGADDYEGNPPSVFFVVDASGEPCPVYLELHLCRGELRVGRDDDCCRNSLRWKLSGVPSPAGANRIMAEVLAEAQEICAEVGVDADGMRRESELSDRGRALAWEMRWTVDSLVFEQAADVSAAEWLSEGVPEELIAASGDREVERIADDCVAAALHGDGEVLVVLDRDDVIAFLTEERDRQRREQ
uniref:hypothetical protein n=1 Tax=Amycolatopsis sp. CA-096443 TaxID=3239919 RepID=UPI003F490E00